MSTHLKTQNSNLNSKQLIINIGYSKTSLENNIPNRLILGLNKLLESSLLPMLRFHLKNGTNIPISTIREHVMVAKSYLNY
jgi:hypothetical protein